MFLSHCNREMGSVKMLLLLLGLFFVYVNGKYAFTAPIYVEEHCEIAKNFNLQEKLLRKHFVCPPTRFKINVKTMKAFIKRNLIMLIILKF